MSRNIVVVLVVDNFFSYKKTSVAIWYVFAGCYSVLFFLRFAKKLVVKTSFLWMNLTNIAQQTKQQQTTSNIQSTDQPIEPASLSNDTLSCKKRREVLLLFPFFCFRFLLMLLFLLFLFYFVLLFTVCCGPFPFHSHSCGHLRYLS